jgi:hypothetical protein
MGSAWKGKALKNKCAAVWIACGLALGCLQKGGGKEVAVCTVAGKCQGMHATDGLGFTGKAALGCVGPAAHCSLADVAGLKLSECKGWYGHAHPVQAAGAALPSQRQRADARPQALSQLRQPARRCS